MKTTRLVSLLVTIAGLCGCSAEVLERGSAQEALEIDDARIVPHGEQLLIEGTASGRPISRLTDTVLVEVASGDLVPWQEHAIEKSERCYYCIIYAEGGGVCTVVDCGDF